VIIIPQYLVERVIFFDFTRYSNVYRSACLFETELLNDWNWGEHIYNLQDKLYDL